MLRAGYADVYVDEREPKVRNRYTVAHELGHLLVQASDAAALGIHGRDEETLCEAFASRLLVGRHFLRETVMGMRLFDLSDLVILCRQFGVSLTAMTFALADVWRPNWGILVLGRRNAAREDARAGTYVVSASAYCRPWFVPNGVTFSKLGLDEVVQWLDCADRGDRSLGALETLSLRLWNPGSETQRSGKVKARASYEARRLGADNALVLLQLDEASVEAKWFERAVVEPDSSRGRL